MCSMIIIALYEKLSKHSAKLSRNPHKKVKSCLSPRACPYQKRPASAGPFWQGRRVCIPKKSLAPMPPSSPFGFFREPSFLSIRACPYQKRPASAGPFWQGRRVCIPKKSLAPMASELSLRIFSGALFPFDSRLSLSKKTRFRRSFLAGETRLEHATDGFGDRCSTIELLPYLHALL